MGRGPLLDSTYGYMYLHAYETSAPPASDTPRVAETQIILYFLQPLHRIAIYHKKN